MMTPLHAAARFAAFTWYLETRAPGRSSRKEAMRFARANWEAFLPVANAGWGRLLLRLAQTPASKVRRSRQHRRSVPVPARS